MSSVKKITIAVLLLAVGLLLLGGCGSSEKNENVVFDEDQHPANWLPSGHMAAAKVDESVCSECHGDDYSGGISRVSCTLCHLGGVNSVHPVSWGTGSQIILNHGDYAQANGTTACSNAYCHGSDLAGVTDSGPACASCHTGGVGSLSSGCASCHGAPPNGSTAPNRAGAHNTTTGHFATQVTLPDSCNTCHSGAGSGTAEHFNGTVDVQLLSSVYSAKSGSAVFNADNNTCSNVSCHGGQTTPDWLTGKIDVATQCTSCHAFGTSEYNSFVSGQHDFHVNTLAKPCIACHNSLKLSQNHFTSLNTTMLEGPAAATIGGGQTEVTDYTNGTCISDCHVPRSWF
jgi:predicted CxxxxCH...CXXCH cytochrome family protein